MNNQQAQQTPAIKKKGKQITPVFERSVKDRRESRYVEKDKSAQRKVARQLKYELS